MRLGRLALLGLLPFIVATCDQLSVATPSTPVTSPYSGVPATQRPSSPASPSLSPGSVAPAAQVTTPLLPHLPEPELTRYGWFRFQASTEGEGTEGPGNPTGDILVDLEAGTLDGASTARIHLREPALPPAAAPHASPFASGPFNNVALYGYWRPNISEHHRLDLLTGEDTLVYRHGHVIDGAVESSALAESPPAPADTIASRAGEA